MTPVATLVGPGRADRPDRRSGWISVTGIALVVGAVLGGADPVASGVPVADAGPPTPAKRNCSVRRAFDSIVFAWVSIMGTVGEPASLGDPAVATPTVRVATAAAG